MRAAQMVQTHPAGPKQQTEALVACIEACFDCEQACTACADACLHEKMVAELVHCIRTDLDCADVCAALGRALSRASKPDADLIRTLTEACIAACRACGAECRKHASKHEHCRVCADACDACERACRGILAATPA
ncbi:MAG TPA: four-helix bundle copper-binding protein [Planctomycetaceae bacterium]